MTRDGLNCWGSSRTAESLQQREPNDRQRAGSEEKGSEISGHLGPEVS